jgi:hypothetical protein
MTDNQSEIIEKLKASFDEMNTSGKETGNFLDIGAIKDIVSSNKTITETVQKANEAAEKLLVEQIQADFKLFSTDLKAIGLTARVDIGDHNRHVIHYKHPDNSAEKSIHYGLKSVGVKREGAFGVSDRTTPYVFTYNGSGNGSKNYKNLEECLADDRQKHAIISLISK